MSSKGSASTINTIANEQTDEFRDLHVSLRQELFRVLCHQASMLATISKDSVVERSFYMRLNVIFQP